MILTCPSCSTQFIVPADAIPEIGREVRCSRCKAQWHQAYIDPVDELTKLDAFQDDLPRVPVMERAPMPEYSSDSLDKSLQDDEAFASAPDTGLESEEGEEDYFSQRRARLASFRPFDNLPTEHTPGERNWMFKIAAVLLIFCIIFLNGLKFHKSLPFLDTLYSNVGMHKTDRLVFEKLRFEKKENGKKLELTVQGSVVNRSMHPMLIPPLRIIILSETGKELGKLSYPTPTNRIKSGEALIIRPTIENVSDSARRIILDIGNSWEMATRPQAKPM